MDLLFSRFSIILILALILSSCSIFSITPNNRPPNYAIKDRGYKFNYDISYQPQNQQQSSGAKINNNLIHPKKTRDINIKKKIHRNNASKVMSQSDSFGPRTHEKTIRGNRLMIDTFYQRIIVDNKEIISIDTVVISNTKLFNAILSWLGTKYRLGGTTRENVDCSALTRALIVSTFNKNVPRTSVEQFRTAKVIDYKNLKEGDLVFFATHRKKRVSHVGMYLGNDYFIHAGTSSGVTLSSLITPYWKKHLMGYGRYNFQ